MHLLPNSHIDVCFNYGGVTKLIGDFTRLTQIINNLIGCFLSLGALDIKLTVDFDQEANNVSVQLLDRKIILSDQELKSLNSLFGET